MAFYWWILLVLTLVCGLYLFLIAPAKKCPDASHLQGFLYAHRGLHDGNHKVPENSLAAFRLAVEHGYGMELDVQLTSDQQLVVHHDGNIRRVCGVDKRIKDLTYEELCRYPLPDGTPIPLFSEVLETVGGKVPMIVEIKQHGGAEKNAAAALALLRRYSGPYCVESFHPLAVRYFKKHAPDIVRGQLAMGGKRNPKDINAVSFFALKHLLINALGRPHFIAYSVPDDDAFEMTLMKRFFHPLLAGWTIRSQKVLDETMQKGYDYPIFELFTPNVSEDQA